jgi:hypothetical protein
VKPEKKKKKKERNGNGERLQESCDQFDLMITNSFFQHKEIHKFTWTQNKEKTTSIYH